MDATATKPFPWVGLLTLSALIFMMVTSEFLPTGLLPEIGHVVMLREGRLFDQGTKERLLADDRLSELFGWEMEVERGNGFYGARLR